jgi:hypothetical protein
MTNRAPEPFNPFKIVFSDASTGAEIAAYTVSAAVRPARALTVAWLSSGAATLTARDEPEDT